MNNTLNYNGYTARIAGIRDIITFHGETVDELIAAFEEAVDDYLEVCERLGQQPNKAYSGKLLLRLPSEVHAAVAARAELSGTSINRWASETLRMAAVA